MKIVIYSVLYLFGLGDNPISVQPRNDCQAIRSDWENIGKDFYKAGVFGLGKLLRSKSNS